MESYAITSLPPVTLRSPNFILAINDPIYKIPANLDTLIITVPTQFANGYNINLNDSGSLTGYPKNIVFNLPTGTGSINGRFITWKMLGAQTQSLKATLTNYGYLNFYQKPYTVNVLANNPNYTLSSSTVPNNVSILTINLATPSVPGTTTYNINLNSINGVNTSGYPPIVQINIPKGVNLVVNGVSGNNMSNQYQPSMTFILVNGSYQQVAPTKSYLATPMPPWLT